MMKRTLRIALAPFMLTIRLLLGLAAFVTSIASSVLGLTVGLFALLGVVEFAIGYWQNGIAFMALALLASPIGLPMVADFLLNRMDHILGFFEGKLCGNFYLTTAVCVTHRSPSFFVSGGKHGNDSDHSAAYQQGKDGGKMHKGTSGLHHESRKNAGRHTGLLSCVCAGDGSQ